VTPSPYPPTAPNNVTSPVPFNSSFTIGDVVPNHAPRPHSILSLSYKRPLPNELSRLCAGVIFYCYGDISLFLFKPSALRCRGPSPPGFNETRDGPLGASSEVACQTPQSYILVPSPLTVYFLRANLRSTFSGTILDSYVVF
jgi:hypothetical protein